MCVAIAIKPGARLTHSEWDRCWTANPDGGGYAYIRRGRIQVERSLSRGDLWRRYFKDATNNPKSPFTVHFRIATHGAVTVENTHPFRVEHDYKGETVVAHNGIISSVVDSLLPDESDTRGFVRMYLRHLPAGWMDNVAIWELVEGYLADSKVVILTTDRAAKGNLYIVNESKGEWIGDKWFSNTYWEYTLSARALRAYPSVPGVWEPYTRGTFKVSTYGRPVVPGCNAPGSVQSLREIRPGRVDKRGVYHTPYLPAGTHALDGMSEDALTDMMVRAIDNGFCERCLWKPCYCEGVCYECLIPLDDCECGSSLSCAAYYVAMGEEAEGDTWLDTAVRPTVRDVAHVRVDGETLSADEWLEGNRALHDGADEGGEE